MDPKYTVIVKDTQFQLTKEQIQFDSPNYFTSCFLGDFKESKEGKQTVSIQRHPVLFELIVDYLTGYDIFPLPQSSLIPTMSPLALLKNLKKDALFYGLDGLCEQVDEQVEQINEKLQAQEVPKSSAAIEYEYYLLVRGYAPRLVMERYKIDESAVPAYIDHFRRGDLGSQRRDWIPSSDVHHVLMVWSGKDTNSFAYALIRRPRQEEWEMGAEAWD